MVNNVSPKNAFLDSPDNRAFIKLESTLRNMEKLNSILKDGSFAIALLKGAPGCGKTFLLNQIYENLKNEQNMMLLQMPPSSAGEFCKSLFEMGTSVKYSEKAQPLKQLNDFLKKHPDSTFTVLIDEMQICKDDVIEFLRITSDTKRVRFLFAIHENKKDDIFEKEHFSSRISEIIKVKELNKKETGLYARSRLLWYDFGDIAIRMSDKSIKVLHGVTKGNFRKINKILYKTFDIYSYFQGKKELGVLGSEMIESKYIEMAAIDLGMIRG